LGIATEGGEEVGKEMEYGAGLKARMVRRMTGPQRISATALSREAGIPQPTLSKWLREAGTVRPVPRKEPPPGSPRPAVAKRPQDWTAAEKLDAVLEATRLGEAELGEFLRTRGLHREHIEQWRRAAEGGLARPGQASPEARRVRELEKELRRKEKALAEAAALLVLKKKVEAIWGDEDDDTEPRSGK
jgi:transposase-like protein